MKAQAVKRALLRTYVKVNRNHTLQMAAALSYYCVLSLFPALIFFSALIAYVRLPNLFPRAMEAMARVLPPDAMQLVQQVLASVISPNKGAFLSLGILGTLWTVSSGFSAIIEALDVAYEVDDDRAFWKTRLLAVALAFITGALLVVALGIMMVGPGFGGWLSARLHLSSLFVALWPYIHWSVAVGFGVVAVEALYFLGPNVKQDFLVSLPGAALAVGCWIGLSYLLGLYFRHFAHYNKTYGTLGGAIVLMVWLYWTGFAMLLGAELNAAMARARGQHRLRRKEESPEPPLDKAA